MSDLLAALSLVLVMEGLLLFAAPALWKRTMADLLIQPESRLRAFGGVMVAGGLIALHVVRGG